MLPVSAFRTVPILGGRFVRLEPLEERHATALAEAGRDPEVFRYLRYSPGGSVEAMLGHIQTLETRHRAGTDLPFAIVRRADDRPIGMTRFLEIDRENAAVEIGGTWFDRTLWGTVVNPESKRLMLAHAFEAEGVNRVQIKTDSRNLRSQRAIEKLGAIREGVLRNHVVMPDGYLRSSVYFSILCEEWPIVRSRLDHRIADAVDPVAPSGFP